VKKLNILITLCIMTMVVAGAIEVVYTIITKVPPSSIPKISFPQSSPAATPAIVITPSATPSSVLVKVIRVVDGDTIEIETGEKLRYIGVNTPESVDPRRPVQCYGKEASVKNKELVEGKMVRLEKDVSNTDKYGRLLRYVWIRDTMINEQLVREGYAQVDTFPPDVKYKARFVAAEQLAQQENKGLWGSACKMVK
jgi:micrococcal nuclease